MPRKSRPPKQPPVKKTPNNYSDKTPQSWFPFEQGQKSAQQQNNFIEKFNEPEMPVPSYFLSLEVQNVKCFGPRQKLDLSDGTGHPAQWTVILGDNGVGKTTLLQCLAALEPTAVRRSRELPPSGFAWVAPLISTGRLSHFNWNPLRQNARTCKVSSITSFGSAIKNQRKPLKVKNLFFQVDNRGDVGWEEKKTPKTGNLICYGYGASRRMRESPRLEGELPVERWTTLFLGDAGLPDAEEWLLQTFLQMKNSSGEISKQYKKQFDVVVETLTGVLPDVERIWIPELTEVGQKTRVRFATPYAEVKLNELGVGHRTMIAWVVDLARRLFERYPDSENPLSESAVVLVDEIDLHLHPSWQRKLINYLTERFPNTQFIVTAHSPLIVQAASDVGANLAVLKRKNDHVVIEQHLPSIRGWEIDQILLSGLFDLPSNRSLEMENLLNQRRAILSKGEITKADERELQKLEKRIGILPFGERPEEIEAFALIQRAAQRLKEQGA